VLAAEIWMQGVNSALNMEWRGIEVRTECRRDTAQGIDSVRRADGIVCNDREFVCRDGLEDADYPVDRARNRVFQ
jgi:hypothetical protein